MKELRKLEMLEKAIKATRELVESIEYMNAEPEPEPKYCCWCGRFMMDCMETRTSPTCPAMPEPEPECWRHDCEYPQYQEGPCCMRHAIDATCEPEPEPVPGKCPVCSEDIGIHLFKCEPEPEPEPDLVLVCGNCERELDNVFCGDCWHGELEPKTALDKLREDADD